MSPVRHLRYTDPSRYEAERSAADISELKFGAGIEKEERRGEAADKTENKWMGKKGCTSRQCGGCGNQPATTEAVRTEL